MTRWVERPVPTAAYADLQAAGLSPLLARLYAARGVTSAAELSLEGRDLAPASGPSALYGLDAAARILADALMAGKGIVIVGDYDCDGATATALLVEALQACGAARVDYVVPNRFTCGYGLTPAVLELIPPAAEVLVTVDNGISSLEGVREAKARGLQVVITDHHLPGAELPAADAIVNPNQPACPFPWKGSAGVAVAFYLAAALRSVLDAEGWFAARPRPSFAPLWDLVALGTVADVVPLERNNRILVMQGLRRLNAGRGRPGLQALLEVAGRASGRLQASDLGFILGPRINAAGRLEDMEIGIRLLLAPDLESARPLAMQLDELNRRRRGIEDDMRNTAEMLLEVETELLQNYGLCLFEPDWHAGVVGIVAGRLRERYHRPVIAFADLGDGWLQGSGRSIPALHLRDALAQCATQAPGLLGRFGGHAMAAGLRLRREALPQFQALFEAVLRDRLSAEDLEESIATDGSLRGAELGLETAHLLEGAGPWGNRFPEPLFSGSFRVCDWRLLKGGHLRFTLETPGGQRLEAVQFHPPAEPRSTWIEALYIPEINRYRGEERLQLRLRQWQCKEENDARN